MRRSALRPGRNLTSVRGPGSTQFGTPFHYDILRRLNILAYPPRLGRGSVQFHIIESANSVGGIGIIFFSPQTGRMAPATLKRGHESRDARFSRLLRGKAERVRRRKTAVASGG